LPNSTEEAVAVLRSEILYEHVQLLIQAELWQLFFLLLLSFLIISLQISTGRRVVDPDWIRIQ
jgi:hypothetical protein